MGLEILAYIGIFFGFVIGIVTGGVATFFFRGMMVNRQLRIAQRRVAKITGEAEIGSKHIIDGAKREAEKIKATADADNRERRAELQRQESRLGQKTEAIEWSKMTESISKLVVFSCIVTNPNKIKVVCFDKIGANYAPFWELWLARNGKFPSKYGVYENIAILPAPYGTYAVDRLTLQEKIFET